MSYNAESIDAALKHFLGETMVTAIYETRGSGSSRVDLLEVAAIQIFVDSPNDVSPEREIIREALSELRHVGYLTFTK